jgi:hypothetical protein
MKKNIIIAAVLMLICLNNLSAQESTQVKASVARNFEEKFLGASNVRWTAEPKGISLAQFRIENDAWVAYFSPEGNLITSGRKIKSSDQLPIKVKEALNNVESKYESKFGSFQYGGIYEMTSDNGTQYFVPLESQKLSMMVSITDGGSSNILRKDHHDLPNTPDPTAIAKKN